MLVQRLMEERRGVALALSEVLQDGSHVEVVGIDLLVDVEQVLGAFVAQLVQDFKYNPKLVIYVRADENSRMKDFVALTDACTKKGISRYSIRTEPPPNR